uniref:Variant erythrocyte surface antigen-1, beta subunit n=1 Tax=Babesia bovis TaxID=5865 RepID=A7AX20_BABBO|eukprot:XP_001609166.1 variant erythrocyte surface antigen-1, beta subunit [Babesia bovis T2Bo]
MSKTWPYSSLTQAPTNLKEAIDWVLRVTGRDGKENKAAAKPAPAGTDSSPHCLCYLAKAVKDLLYDAKDPGSPGPSPDRYWDDLLLDQEKTLVLPVLTDLGLLSTGSTSAVSTTTTCAGGTEVIKALIDQLAQGLQKWVGWQEKGDDCCLKGTDGIGKKCDCPSGVGASGCCSTSSGTPCHQCSQCGTSEAGNKCYLSAYCKKNGVALSPPEGEYYWPTISSDPSKVHLLARIFLGSVCLIWSGLSQLGFLTGNGSSRWKDSKLHEVDKGLGSFMAAMGYDLERLNGSGGSGKKGADVWKLLSGTEPSGAKGIQWKEFASVKGASQGSVAEYYSSIYSGAKTALTGKNTEEICTKYPLLVLHILASGYFRAGSAGANKVTVTASPATEKKETPSPRKPRTIREILYWLSALPYSKGYKALVERMGQKFPEGGKYSLEGTKSGGKTDLHKDNITHYLLAACGYCPLVLIGIQGTIEREVKQTTQGSAPAAAEKNKCPHHKKNRHKRCDPKDIKEQEAAAQAQSPQQPGASTGKPLGKGEVCYGGYHLEVSKFGPLHGMYANGLFGFQMDLSAAQCLDQLRVYVYHCFYQLYFLRKQCTVGVDKGTALGWQSCRYGSGVYWGSGYSPSNLWKCKTDGGAGAGEHTKKCGLQDGASGKEISPLMCFLCDGLGKIACPRTVARSLERYPPIEEHMNTKYDFPPGHLEKPHGHCPVPMGWQQGGGRASSDTENHFKGSGAAGTYPAHCTGNTLSLLLEYHCDPEKCHGTLVVLLRLLACITPTVPRTLGDLFGFYYYIVYIGGNQGGGAGEQEVNKALGIYEQESKLHMMSIGGDAVVTALETYGGDCKTGKEGHLKCLYKCTNGGNTKQCSPYLCPLSGQQYGQLSPAMAGTYLSWLVYLIEGFRTGLEGLKGEFQQISCTHKKCHDFLTTLGNVEKSTEFTKLTTSINQLIYTTRLPWIFVLTLAWLVAVLYLAFGAIWPLDWTHMRSHCRGWFRKGSLSPWEVLMVGKKKGRGILEFFVLVLVKVSQKFGGTFAESSIRAPSAQQCPRGSNSVVGTHKKCHEFLGTLDKVLTGDHLKNGSKKGLHYEINQLIYTTRLPWIFVLTIAWLVAVLYLAFGAIWPLDWTHMRSHCRGLFRKGSLSPWEILMVGKKKGRGILEFFGKT